MAEPKLKGKKVVSNPALSKNEDSDRFKWKEGDITITPPTKKKKKVQK